MSIPRYYFLLTVYRALMMLAKGLKKYIDDEVKLDPALELSINEDA